MPTRYCVSFTLPEVRRNISFMDVHRLACYLLEEPGPEAHSEQVKGFSVWPLQYDEREWHLQLHGLDDSVSLSQIESRLKGTPHLGRDLPLIDTRVTYEHASFESFINTHPRREQAVEFVSPTTFSRNGRSYSLPDPVLVHQQLIRRWNLFSPKSLEISESTSRELTSAVTLQRCEVSAERIPDIGSRVGFTGNVVFRLGSSAGSDIFSALWQFACFSGVGALTTQGLGAIRLSR